MGQCLHESFYNIVAYYNALVFIINVHRNISLHVYMCICIHTLFWPSAQGPPQIYIYIYIYTHIYIYISLYFKLSKLQPFWPSAQGFRTTLAPRVDLIARRPAPVTLPRRGCQTGSAVENERVPQKRICIYIYMHEPIPIYIYICSDQRMREGQAAADCGKRRRAAADCGKRRRAAADRGKPT